MKILCLGDSNTYGYDPRSFFGDRYEKPWPEQLSMLLSCQCINLGENGAEIPQGPSSYEWTRRRIASELPAERLLIMLGTNDALYHPRDAKSVVRARMIRFLGEMQAAFPDLPMTVMVPVAAGGTDLSEVIGEACAVCGVPCVNCCHELPLAHDGVHLTEAGHSELARRLADELKGE